MLSAGLPADAVPSQALDRAGLGPATGLGPGPPALRGSHFPPSLAPAPAAGNLLPGEDLPLRWVARRPAVTSRASGPGGRGAARGGATP